MKNFFGTEDKVKEHKVKIPMDFEDESLEYDSTNKMDFGSPKMKIKVKKTKSVGVKKTNGKNDLF